MSKRNQIILLCFVLTIAIAMAVPLIAKQIAPKGCSGAWCTTKCTTTVGFGGRPVRKCQ